MVVNPYLNFKGNTMEAFNFYKSVFGGEFAGVMLMKDSPGGDKLPPEQQNQVMHVSLPIGDGNMLMGTDVPDAISVDFGTNVWLCIAPDSKEQADQFFAQLSEGGNVLLPMTDMFWGDYYGQVTDRFKIQWMINYSPNYVKR